VNSRIGGKTISHSTRKKIIRELSIHLNYKPLIFSDSEILSKINKKFVIGNKSHPIFDLSDPLWENIYFWM
jgi:hypothetical protein